MRFKSKILLLPRVAAIHKEISLGLRKCPYATGVPSPSEKEGLETLMLYPDKPKHKGLAEFELINYSQERLIKTLKKEVKQLMEESVAKKTVHEESSNVSALCRYPLIRTILILTYKFSGNLTR